MDAHKAEYPVLADVSICYPRVKGRLLTRYSPVRHSCTPKGLTVRLACVKHAASVRPEPESNSPNKNPHTQRAQAEFTIREIRSSNKTPKLASKNNPPLNGKKRQAKKQQTKTTKHTIEFSNNRPAWPRKNPRLKAVGSRRTDEDLRLSGLPSGGRRALRVLGPCRSDFDKLRQG